MEHVACVLDHRCLVWQHSMDWGRQVCVDRCQQIAGASISFTDDGEWRAFKVLNRATFAQKLRVDADAHVASYRSTAGLLQNWHKSICKHARQHRASDRDHMVSGTI